MHAENVDLELEVEKLLEEWECHDMIGQIRGQGFSLAVLKALTPDSAKKYFEFDGPWILFCQKLEDWKKSQQQQPIDPTADDLRNEEMEEVIRNTVFIIEGYLRADKEGKIIMMELDKGEDDLKLDNEQRNIIADTIILAELQSNYETATIDSKRFIRFTKAVLQIFKNEKAFEWYIPPRKVLDTNVAAKGKFYDRYIFQLSRLRKRKVRSSQRQSVEIPVTPVNRDIEKAKEWLKEGNIRDWGEVKRNWKLTCLSRIKALQNGADEPDQDSTKKRKSVCIHPRGLGQTTYFQDYKVILQQPMVIDLIQIDFTCLYPNADRFFDDHWPRLREFIRYMTKLPENFSDLDILLDFGKLFDIAILNGKYNRETKKKPQWRASRIEVQQGFLLCVRNRDSFINKVKSIKKKLDMVKKPFQPLACAIVPKKEPDEDDNAGENKENDEEIDRELDQIEEVEADPEFFVLWNEREIKTDSALEAVKLTLKLCMVFHLAYQYQSTITWITFQQLAFDIRTDWDTSSKSSEKILSCYEEYKNDHPMPEPEI